MNVAQPTTLIKTWNTSSHITVEGLDGSVVVQVDGEVDMVSAPRLTETVMTVLRHRPPVLVIDLQAVTFLGVSGLAALIAARQRAGERTRLRVVAGPACHLPLSLTGWERRLVLYTTREDALEPDAVHGHGKNRVQHRSPSRY